jgi:hypothetical protein
VGEEEGALSRLQGCSSRALGLEVARREAQGMGLDAYEVLVEASPGVQLRLDLRSRVGSERL